MHEKNTLSKLVILCLLAELLNIIGAAICETAHLPLFLDTIGTVLIVFYAGLVPGLIVAACYNILWVQLLLLITHASVHPWDMLYAICGLVITVTTWLFSCDKENFRSGRFIAVLYLMLIALVSAFASSITGGLIETGIRIHFQEQHTMKALEQFVRAFLGENLGLFAACVIARVPITVLDRIICTFAGFGLYLLLHRMEKRHVI